MSSERTAGTWDQFKNKLSAHWGKLTLDDLRLTHRSAEPASRAPPADCESETLMADRAALARSGS